MRPPFWSVLVLVACGGPDPDTGRETATDSDSPTYFPTTDTGPRTCEIPDDGEWRILADPVGDGVLFSAWGATWQEVLMVGGAPGGESGVILHYTPGEICVEADSIDAALWWIHGPRKGEWYAVGAHGIVLHDVDGERTREDIGSDITLYGVWATDDVVWAVGGDPFTDNSGEIWKRSGGVWTREQDDIDGVPYKVWEGWIVGDKVAYRIEGDTLVPIVQPDRLLTVRGRNGDEVYAVGGVGNALMKSWSDDAWTAFDTTGLSPPLSGIWTDAGEDIWVAGLSGLTARWDGAAWEQAIPPVSLEHFHAAYGNCDEVLFLGGNLLAANDNYGTIVRYGTPKPRITPTICD